MSIRETDPQGARELLEADEPWTLVDVRSPEEFLAGHVPGAFNVPLAFRGPLGMQLNPGFAAAMKRHFETDARLVLVCAAGVRSRHACELLAAEGFSTLANMNGGMHGGADASGLRPEPGWLARDLPVTREPQGERTWEALSRG